MSRRWLVLAALASAAVGISEGSRQLEYALAGPQPALRWATWSLALAAALAASLAPVSLGVRAWTAATACAVLLEEAAGPATGWGWVMTVGLIAGSAHANGAIGTATASAERPGHGLHRFVVVNTVTACALTGLLVDPSERGCGACVANPLAVSGQPPVADFMVRVSAGICLLLAVICVANLIRPGNATELASTVGTVAAAAATTVLAIPRLTEGAEGAATGAWRATAAGALLIVASSMWGDRIADARRRAALARLVGRAAAAVAPGGIEQALRMLTGDPGLELRYRLNDTGLNDTGLNDTGLNDTGLNDTGLIDPSGAPAPTPVGPVTELIYDEAVIAVLARSDRVALDRRHIDLISTTAGLAIAHEREAAVLAAHLRVLAGVRRKLIISGDLERRALERELHDHAQQRLVSIMIELRMAAPREPAPAEIENAMLDMQHALDEVRTIAHGIYPEVLVEEGLIGALKELVLQSDGRVAVETPDSVRAEPVVEATAYLIAAECARSAGGQGINLRISTTPGCLTLQASTDNTTNERFSPLKARTIALGGVWDSDGGTLKVTLPCAS